MESWYDLKFSKPKMTKAEFEFLKQSLSTDDIMLEYGSGYSTPNIAPLVKELWSVEHHPTWFKRVSDMCVGFDNIKQFLIELDVPRIPPKDWNLNPNAKYGFPTPFECVKSYSTWILTQSQKFNKVLIDGRGRQWVAQFIMNNLCENHEVFIHDYIDRTRYFVVEQFYDKIEVVDSMAKFKLKRNYIIE